MAETAIINDVQNVILREFKKRNLSVEKIVLFGSYAANQQNEDSDIDIIVISPEFRGKKLFQKTDMAAGVHWKIVETVHEPIDLLYYSDIDWQEDNSLMIRAAKQDGKILYDAKKAA